MIHKTTRSILSVLLAVLLLVTSIPLTPAFAGDGGAVPPQSESAEGRALTGEGTAGNPYKIATADDLLKFADKVNNQGQTSAWAILTADIVLNEKIEVDENGTVTNQEKLSEWTPIGTSINNPYEGNFNGAGHTISGLYINRSADYQGLFGRVNGGTVKDLTVSGTVSGNYNVGGVVGYNNGGTVTGCIFSGSGSVSGKNYVGGVVGYNDGGTVTGCIFSGSGSVSGEWYVGGIAGRNDGTVENCYNTGSVNGSADSSDVGGVVGLNRGTVENCYNTGEVSGNSYVGGVVGYNISSVTNCYNTGEVSGKISGGGVVGWNSVSVVGDNRGSVENCYNTGNVSGGTTSGGVVGYNNGDSVTNCYNTGEVSGGSKGGVVGYNDGDSVTNCYFLQTDGVPANGIGSGSGDTTSVTTLDALCDALKGDTTTWTISPFCKHPVLQANPEGGLGTATHPYEIKTIDQLKTFRDLVNGEGGNPNAHAKLMNNINLNPDMKISEDGTVTGAHDQWIPIGNSSINQYRGNFDGNEKTISGLYIDNDADYQGLFGYVSSSGKVQNLSVSGSVKGNDYVGGVVGQNSGSVENCHNTGTVTGTYSYVGGVVGYNSGPVKNCYNTGNISGKISGESYGNTSGGVVGWNSSSGSVENCYNTGAVNISGNISLGTSGGVVGGNGGTVENCYNTGDISGGVSGGVVGVNISSVTNCYNIDDVSGNTSGGVVGWNSDSVTNCYNIGDVSGNISGGVVGDNRGSVENCYNTGNVSGGISGGVVGYNDSSASVANCYNTGSVSDGTYTGGVVGQHINGSITNCYFLQTADVNKDLPGIGTGTGTATEKDNTAFHSGEVAHLLGEAWGQSALGTDNSWPTLVALDNSAKTVYQVTVDYNYDGAQNKTTYTNDPAEPAAPARDGYTFGGWDKTGEGTTTITYTAKWTAEEPPYTGKYSYEVFTSVGDNGSLTVDRYATEGDKVTIDVTPDQAYKLDDLSVTANGKDVELTAGGDGTYTFTMPSADVRITATFAEDPDWTEPEEPTTDVSDLFIDIAPDAWYKDAVQYAYDNGLMTGVSATEFAPEATTTRAMIVSILARLEGVTTAEAAGFADVDDNDWYATAVNWAANVGVVNGYEDNTFKPNTAITREQLAAILMNYAAYKGEDVSNRADLTSYTDQPSTWAQEAMQWAVAEGLISGVTNDELQPQSSATRAQVAAILQRLLEA